MFRCTFFSRVCLLLFFGFCFVSVVFFFIFSSGWGRIRGVLVLSRVFVSLEFLDIIRLLVL